MPATLSITLRVPSGYLVCCTTVPNWSVSLISLME